MPIDNRIPDAITLKAEGGNPVRTIERDSQWRNTDIRSLSRNQVKELSVLLHKCVNWTGYPSTTEIGQRFHKEHLQNFALAVYNGDTLFKNPFESLDQQSQKLDAEIEIESISTPVEPESMPVVSATAVAPATKPNDAQAKLDALRELLGAGSVDIRQVEAVVEEKLASTVEGLNANYGSFVTAVSQLVNEEIKKAVAVEYERLLASQIKRIEIVQADGAIKAVGASHKQFETLYRYVEAAMREDAPAPAPARNIMLVGPAGAGKTFVFEQIADALNVPFRFCGALDSKYDLMGYRDANGRYIETEFYRSYCAEFPEDNREAQGGIFLYDELDASNQSAVLSFNAALANGVCDFPIGQRKRHRKQVIVASCNVWDGATSEYVGRSKQDAAFTNRFGVKLAWEYDEALEAHIAGDTNWSRFVQKCRSNVKKAGVQRIISPRASEAGAFFLRCGISWDDVARDCVRQGLSDEKWNILTGGQI